MPFYKELANQGVKAEDIPVVAFSVGEEELAGELRAIIGPNGAGKTTMMDVVTGKTKPDAGEVFSTAGST